MKLTKLLPCLMAFAAMPALASGTTAEAKRVGPVSYYGALQSSGGQIMGAKTNQKAIVRGMSLFWSDATGMPYYSKTVMTWAVDNLKIDVVRFALGIQYYDDTRTNEISTGYSYKTAGDSYMNVIDDMVEAAVENDIYLIIDWHSHLANSETAMAKPFFEAVAQKYGKIPNVIFEIFNEPTCGSSEIASYANTIIPVIRKYSDNLIIVGTPSWSAEPNSVNGVSGTNLAYALHFYAASHSSDSYGPRATSAQKNQKAVFVSEYGTVNYDGAGSPDPSASESWFNFMDQNNLSSCNWSLRQAKTTENGKVKNETSAMFDGDVKLTSRSLLDNATYSTSGSIVKKYLTSRGRSWNDSLTKGKRSGTCAAKHITALDTMKTMANALPAGCTYVSSNENVVSVSGSNLVINSHGYAVLTANDGTQTVVTVNEIPNQTVPNHIDLTCNYSGDCTTNRTVNYSGSGKKEWVVTTETKTLEGSTFTLTSLNPDVVKIKKATCSTTFCSSTQENKQVLMYEFVGYGSAKIVATAPAVPGYKAVNDTVTVTYNKGNNKITENFKDVTLDLGATSPKLLPDTTLYHTPVTYTFNGKATTPYATKSGNGLVAGTQNAALMITAHAPEVENYKEFQKSITVIVGDVSKIVNQDEYVANGLVVKTNPKLPLHATVQGNLLSVSSDKSDDMSIGVFSVNGQKVLHEVVSTGNAVLSLASIPTGSYLIVVNQGVRQLTIRWNKLAK